MFVPGPQNQLRIARDLRHPDIERAAADRRLRGRPAPTASQARARSGRAPHLRQLVAAWIARHRARPSVA